MSSVTDTQPDIHPGQTLYSRTTGYSIMEFIGEGVFGKVAKCQNIRTGETVAVKVLKNDPDTIQDTEHELSILKTISVLNPDSVNIVKFFEQFDYMERTCLAFEMLEANLYDLLQHNDLEPMLLRGIRPIAKQLFTALDALKTLGILHTDIKPDNVMVVREREESVRVKLIDFGLAIHTNQVQLGMVCQPIGYRAPEVSIGLPITEAIDVWGVGCVLGFLFLARNLFPVLCEYHMMKRMIEILGMPDEHLLWNGGYTKRLFTLDAFPPYYEIWRLKTPWEYEQKYGPGRQEQDTSHILPRSLDDMMTVFPKEEKEEAEDTAAFVDLMKGLLHLDGAERLTPHQALQHPFVRMTHLSQEDGFSDYFSSSLIMMGNCQGTESVPAPLDTINSWHPPPLPESSDERALMAQWVDRLWFPVGEEPAVCFNGHAQTQDDHDKWRDSEDITPTLSLHEDALRNDGNQTDVFEHRAVVTSDFDGGQYEHSEDSEGESTPHSKHDDPSRFYGGGQADLSEHGATETLDSSDGQFEQTEIAVTERPPISLRDVDFCIYEDSQTWSNVVGQPDQCKKEDFENFSWNEHEQTQQGVPAATDMPTKVENASGGLRKRVMRFFKSLKRRTLRSCCCCLLSDED